MGTWYASGYAWDASDNARWNARDAAGYAAGNARYAAGYARYAPRNARHAAGNTRHAADAWIYHASSSTAGGRTCNSVVSLPPPWLHGTDVAGSFPASGEWFGNRYYVVQCLCLLSKGSWRIAFSCWIR